MFEVVKGQNIAVKMLSQELGASTLPQTLLFHGPDGSGKFLAALELARLLNCTNGGAGGLTGSKAPGGAAAAGGANVAGCNCSSCRSVERLSSKNIFFICKSNLRNTFDLWKRFGVPEGKAGYFLRDVERLFLSIVDEERYRKDFEFLGDVLRIPEDILRSVEKVLECAYALFDAQRNAVISINRVRELQRFLWMKSGAGKYKVVIVDGVEHMNEESANSFLKISEDTPPDSVIIITSTRKELLKETIQSRFRAYRFIELSRSVREEIAREKFGVPNGAQNGVSSGTLSGTPLNGVRYDRGAMEEYFTRLSKASSRTEGILELIDNLVENGQTVQFLSYLIDILREKLRLESRPAIERIYQIESIMKTAEFHRGAILVQNANQEISLTDFLLNNYYNILQL